MKRADRTLVAFFPEILASVQYSTVLGFHQCNATSTVALAVHQILDFALYGPLAFISVAILTPNDAVIPAHVTPNVGDMLISASTSDHSATLSLIPNSPLYAPLAFISMWICDPLMLLFQHTRPQVSLLYLR